MARPRPKRSPKPPAADESPFLDPIALLPWAYGIALGVARDYNFLRDSTEEEELRSTAAEALVELMHRFDESLVPTGGSVVGAFKGFATVEIRSRSRRHACRLRNGGLYRTTTNPEAWKLNVKPLPTCRGAGEDAEDCPLPWPEREEVPELQTRYGKYLFVALVRLDCRIRNHKNHNPLLAVAAECFATALFGDVPALQTPAPAGCNPTTPGLSRFRSKTDRNRPAREPVAGKNCA